MPHQEWRDADGHRLPSVTEIIGLYKPKALVDWYGRVGLREAERISSEAAALGSDMHGRIEEMIDRGAAMETEDDDKAGELALRAYEWMSKEGVVVVEKEVGILNALDGYGGTADLICRFHKDPTLWVADWKSSGSIHETYRLQLAAYARSYNVREGLTWANGISCGVIVRPDKKKPLAPPQVKRYTGLEADYEVFAGLLELWKWLDAAGEL